MKTGGIMAIVSFPLMKLIIETKFNLFKTFELCWIVYWINLISFISESDLFEKLKLLDF